jgi:hypothetical protein
MAGIKISALPAAGSALLTDLIPAVQAGVTVKETLSQVLTLFTSSLSSSFVPLAGGTMTGPLILSADATMPLQAVTYEQLQTVAAGFTVILAAQAATTANLTAVYANGASGVGATLTNSGAQAAFVVDGYSGVVNDRILVKNQTSSFQNGVYSVTTVGTGSTNWVLTRTTDYDQAPSEIKPGTLIAVNNGTVNATTSWLETATVTTVGTDPIVFSQFTFSPSAFLQKSLNLSDLASVPTALVNLGLGVPTGTGNVVRQTSPTLITPILGAASATSLTFTSTSGIIGTTTNDSAAAGSVGEFQSSNVVVGSAVSLSNGVATNITSLPVNAGDYDIWGWSATSAAGGAATSTLFTGINTTSATLPTAGPNAPFTFLVQSNPGANNTYGLTLPAGRFSFAVPTTLYLVMQAGFPSGTVHGYGFICARRRR